MSHILPCGLPSNLVAIELKKNRDRFEAGRKAGAKVQNAAASAFAIGQTVRTKLNDRGTSAPLVAVIVAIDDGKITLDDGRTFLATALTA